MFDFIERHPYLTSAAFTNLFVFTFFPSAIITALTITAAVFATYGINMLIVQFFNWAFFPTEEVPARYRADLTPDNIRENPALDNIYINRFASKATDEATEELVRPTNALELLIPPLAEEESARLTSALKLLIPPLIEEGISFQTFRAPIIASDRFLYDYTDESYCDLIRRQAPSAYTRAPFENDSFPFFHNKLHQLCDTLRNPNNTVQETLQSILDLAICPVTKEIMKDPQIAHLVYTDRRGLKETFVLVCDRKALTMLPSCISLAKEDLYKEEERESKNYNGKVNTLEVKVCYRTVDTRTDWEQLKNITNDNVIGPKLQQALEAAFTHKEKETDPILAWQAAYTQAKIDFPSVKKAMPQSSSNPQSFYYSKSATNSSYSEPGASASYRY